MENDLLATLDKLATAVVENSKTIDVHMERIEHKLDEILAKLMAKSSGGKKAKASETEPASDEELDSQYGDPVVRKDPPIWLKQGGESFVGKPFSKCEADYLDALAQFFEWKAGKDEEKGTDEGAKYAAYGRRDAARARGWAKRLRERPQTETKRREETGEFPF